MSNFLEQFKTLNEVLDYRADHQKDRLVYRFLVDGDETEVTLTYGKLLSQSSSLASQLLSMAKPGDRAMILMPSGLDFIIAFFACLRAGIISVPVYPLRKIIKKTSC